METTKSAEVSKSGVKTYELGFLITPLLPEEQARALVGEQLAGLIGKLGGELRGEDGLKLQTLAYPIRQVVEHKSNIFREAYFGALRFGLAAEQLPEFAKKLKKVTELIRTLVLVLPVDYAKKPERRPVTRPAAAAEAAAVPEAAPARPAVDTAKIDREIEKLI